MRVSRNHADSVVIILAAGRRDLALLHLMTITLIINSPATLLKTRARDGEILIESGQCHFTQ